MTRSSKNSITPGDRAKLKPDKEKKKKTRCGAQRNRNSVAEQSLDFGIGEYHNWCPPKDKHLLGLSVAKLQHFQTAAHYLPEGEQ
jgi:hypothetical protein